MKKYLFAALMLCGTLSISAKHVVPVDTSCGKTAHIDTDRTTLQNTLKQIAEIEKVLCGDNK